MPSAQSLASLPERSLSPTFFDRLDDYHPPASLDEADAAIEADMTDLFPFDLTADPDITQIFNELSQGKILFLFEKALLENFPISLHFNQPIVTALKNQPISITALFKWTTIYINIHL